MPTQPLVPSTSIVSIESASSDIGEKQTNSTHIAYSYVDCSSSIDGYGGLQVAISVGLPFLH